MNLFTWLFSKPKPTLTADQTRAIALWKAAKARYDDALDRGDTRDQAWTWQGLKRAQARRLELGV